LSEDGRVARFRLLLEYDGSAFQGWQIQTEGVPTVQGALAQALEKISGQPARVTGSGRTDTGVHAEGQVASIDVETRLEAGDLLRALNGNLPRQVAVLEVSPCGAGFDARRGTISKLYRYQIWNGRLRSPLRAGRFAHVPADLDVQAMRKAAGALVGRHDFACFQASGSDIEYTVREILRLDLVGEAGGEISLEVEGTGFLRHMVRNIAGTLIEVGKGRRPPESIEALLASCDRGKAGPTAPAQGLSLICVRYPEGAAAADGESEESPDISWS
jgi:tRNA pseudouridine38-40 synthase